MRFIDPAEDPLVKSSPYQFVDRDLRSIESADAVLANMWRESVGTAIGLVHARAKGRIVVVVDPNHLENPFLEFYADVVVKTLKEGIHATADLLRSSTFTVIKHGGRAEEPFNREKLVQSVRAAARAARKNDIAVPSLVLRRVTDALTDNRRKVGGRVTTSDIEHEVFETLTAMEADPEHTQAVIGIAEQWAKKVKSKGARSARAIAPAGSAPVVSQRVPIFTSKAHGSIWGTASEALTTFLSRPATSSRRSRTSGRVADPAAVVWQGPKAPRRARTREPARGRRPHLGIHRRSARKERPETKLLRNRPATRRRGEGVSVNRRQPQGARLLACRSRGVAACRLPIAG